MKARERGCTQATASAKADISERSGRRIDKGEHQPGKYRQRWRSRADPLAAVWSSELEPLLKREPSLKPMTLFQYLQDKHPGDYSRSILRTLQRRVRQWQAQQGPAKPVMFPQEHRIGEQGFSDYTQLKQIAVTINGQPYKHCLYHYRLAYSGWQYVEIVEGGESFASLSECLQNALYRCGGVPREHRTDSLSAAYRNLGRPAESDLTCNYHRLCEHYHMRPSRNNRGQGHENGSIESPHGHFKRRLRQALLLRGSSDFSSKGAYQACIKEVVAALNRNCQAEYELERQYLRPLPAQRYPDYELLSVRVSRTSTITVRCILYTVPSRLIGQRLTVHLHHNRLVGFVGLVPVVELARVYAKVTAKGSSRRARCIDYRHVIESLRTKPRALLNCQWREQLLPTDGYRDLWCQWREQLEADVAARLMVEALYIAAKQDKQQAVLDYLQQQWHTRQLTLSGLQQHFQRHWIAPPAVTVQQHSLCDYDQLLTHDFTRRRAANPPPITQIPPPLPHAQAVAGPRAAGP